MPIQPRAPTWRLNSGSQPPHDRARRTLVRPASAARRKSRTSARSASVSGGSSVSAKWKTAMPRVAGVYRDGRARVILRVGTRHRLGGAPVPALERGAVQRVIGGAHAEPAVGVGFEGDLVNAAHAAAVLVVEHVGQQVTALTLRLDDDGLPPAAEVVQGERRHPAE